MSYHIRKLDSENLNSHTVNENKLLSKASTTRLVFGEVGNKIHNNVPQNGNKGKESKLQPLGAVKKTITLVKRPVIGAARLNKKADKAISKLETVVESNLNREKGLVRHPETISNSVSDCATLSYSSKELNQIIDIDTSDNPLHVSEYVQDIYNYLLELEDQFSIEKNFLSGHKSTMRMRTVLINWMVEVHINFKLLLETLHLAVAIVDRYLQLKKQVGRDILQLVGTTAIWIAGKYEDLYIVDIKDLVFICDDTFSKKQFLKMECDILKTLEFNIGRPLSLQFLRRFSRIAAVSSEQHTLGKYLLELGLIDYKLCHIKPSLQAAAACCLSVSVIDELPDPQQAWSELLVHYSKYTYAEIKPIVLLLACALNRIEVSKYNSIRTKYSSASYSQISMNPKLKGSLVKKLIVEATHSKAD